MRKIDEYSQEVREYKNASQLQIVLDDIPDDTVFHGDNTIAWDELSKQMIQQVLSKEQMLLSKGFKRVKIGSIQWYYMRNKKHGRFVAFNTMFYARLCKTVLHPKVSP